MNILFAMSPQQGDGGGSLISTLIMFGAIFLIFYFMIIRPQSKRAKERDKMINAVSKGDKVITSGGLHGEVVSVEDKTVILKVSDNTKLKYEKSAIGSVISKGEYS